MKGIAVESQRHRQGARKIATLALGTVQLGMPYGVANSTGLPDKAEAIAIICAAIEAGVRTIDTARAYGDSERRIGLACPPENSVVEIVTKLDPLADIRPDAAPQVAVAAARASLAASRAALRRDRLDVLLLHRAGHRIAWSGAVWDLLRAEREAGSIGRLGVSVQTPDEAQAAIRDRDVRHVQLPFNLLDRRRAAVGIIENLRARPDVVVHARSVFLQGLLAGSPAARWPAIPGLDPAALLHRLGTLATELNRNGIADLALAFVRAQDWIDGVVIGMETREQLMSNVALFGRAALTPREIAHAQAAIPGFPTTLLDPTGWPQHDRAASPTP